MGKIRKRVEKAEQALHEYNELMGTIYNELPPDRQTEVRKATDKLWTTRNKLAEVDYYADYWSREIERLW